MNSPLLATTRRCTATIDLNAVCRGEGFLFVRDGVGAAGRGDVARTDDRGIPELLGSISHSDPDATGALPIAFGTVPFLATDRSSFVVPRVIVQKLPDGTVAQTLVGTDEHDLSDAAHTAISRELASTVANPPSVNSFTVRQITPVDTYLKAVTAARDAVRHGQITKAVIARDIEIEAEQPLDLFSVLLRLRASFGSSYRYCVDGFIGASPELLIARDGRDVRSHPLAGTAPRTGDAVTDARLAADLIASTKNQIEHRVVIDMVHDTLLPYCSFLDWEPEPSIVTVANVQHLGTAIEGVLSEPAPHVLDLVRLLNPTPALGGHPSREAIDLITSVEVSPRGRYGGAVGWVDSRGNGTWAVAIRCAEISVDRRKARLFAGGGIVADSEPMSELAETQAKFQAMLSAIVRP